MTQVVLDDFCGINGIDVDGGVTTRLWAVQGNLVSWRLRSASRFIQPIPTGRQDPRAKSENGSPVGGTMHRPAATRGSRVLLGASRQTKAGRPKHGTGPSAKPKSSLTTELTSPAPSNRRPRQTTSRITRAHTFRSHLRHRSAQWEATRLRRTSAI